MVSPLATTFLGQTVSLVEQDIIDYVSTAYFEPKIFFLKISTANRSKASPNLKKRRNMSMSVAYNIIGIIYNCTVLNQSFQMMNLLLFF